MSELIPLAHPGISSLARRPFQPSFSLWPMEVAKSLIGSFLKSFRAVIPAAADKGFALNVPLWAMRLVLSHSGSPEEMRCLTPSRVYRMPSLQVEENRSLHKVMETKTLQLHYIWTVNPYTAHNL